MTGTQVARLVSDALDDVDDALSAVLRAGGVEWRSPAADRYRDALEEVAARLRLTRAGVAGAIRAAAALDAAVAASPWRATPFGSGTAWP